MQGSYTELIKAVTALSKTVEALASNQSAQNKVIKQLVDEKENPTLVLNDITPETMPSLNTSEMSDVYKSIEYMRARVMSGRKDFKEIVRKETRAEMDRLNGTVTKVAEASKFVHMSAKDMLISSKLFESNIQKFNDLFKESLDTALDKTAERLNKNIADIKKDIMPIVSEFKRVTAESRDAISVMKNTQSILTFTETIATKMYNALDYAEAEIESVAKVVKTENAKLLSDVTKAVAVVKDGIGPLDDKINSILTNKGLSSCITKDKIGEVQATPITPGRRRRR
jgi:hypothetical protein